MFPALRDEVRKLDDRLRESLCGTLKATGREAALLVALWKEEMSHQLLSLDEFMSEN